MQALSVQRKGWRQAGKVRKRKITRENKTEKNSKMNMLQEETGGKQRGKQESCGKSKQNKSV